MRGSRSLFKKTIFITSIIVLMTATFIAHNFSFAPALWPVNLENKIETPDVMPCISS